MDYKVSKIKKPKYNIFIEYGTNVFEKIRFSSTGRPTCTNFYNILGGKEPHDVGCSYKGYLHDIFTKKNIPRTVRGPHNAYEDRVYWQVGFGTMSFQRAQAG